MPATTIVVLTTGGTISSEITADGAVPARGAADLLGDDFLGNGVPSVGPDANPAADIEIRAEDLMAVDSSALSIADQFRIVAAVARTFADPDVDGIVITHGTDTMEETAYLVDLFAADLRPVVVTGAQLPADAPAADGPRNLADALRIAADPSSRGRGTLIVMGGRMWAARGAFKVSTVDPIGFDTVHPELPRPLLHGDPAHLAHARVDTFTLYPGISPGIIAAAISQHTAAVVLAGTGSGNTHPDVTAQVAHAVAQGIVVVVTSRVPYGPVRSTYGGGGGAVDLERAGAIISRWLRAPQARMALIALLATGHDAEQIRRFFADSAPES